LFIHIERRVMERALKKLRDELRAFHNTGLRALRDDLEAARFSVQTLPGRGSWLCCPLSYRLGDKGSVDRDSAGHESNAFTDAWDGVDGQEMFDELVLLEEVKAEIERRKQKDAKKQKERKHVLNRAVPTRHTGPVGAATSV
jgi:hypothetical protein